MKKSSLIAVATALLALSGCADHSAFGPQTEQDEKEYNSFDFSTINNNVAVNIGYSVNLEASVFFSIYDQEPGSWVENAYVLKDGIQPLYSGWTSKDGTFSATLSLPSYLKKVYVYTPAMFSTRIMEAEVNGSQINVAEKNYASQAATRATEENTWGAFLTDIDLDNWKLKHQSGNNNHSYMVDNKEWRPAEYNDGNWKDWLVTYNNQGMLYDESLIKNSDKDDADLYLGKKLAGELYEAHQAVINVNKKECPQNLRSEYDMLITKEGEIAINFLGGSTCWNSSLGYYVYRDGEKPKSLAEANVVLVFPNTQDGFKTYTYNGETTKGVFTGSCVKLKYYPNIASGSKEGETYEFPAGYRIGFVLATNAWSERIKGWLGTTWERNFKVRSATSSGLSVDRNGKIFNEPRTAVYKYTDENKKDYIMVSFEDNTDDNNFSDVVFTLTTRATIDKIPDVDPKEEVNELKGIYAFEDLWPAKGDYDMNDVMTKSTYTKLIDSKNNIYEESYTFKTYGNYATLTNGLAVRLDGVSTTDKLEFYVKAVGDEDFSALKTTYDATDRVVVLTNDVNTNKGAEYKVKVIHAENSPVEKETIDAEPFIFRAENSSDAVAWWEVHLTGCKPTSKMNRNYFGKGEDCSQPDKDIYYVRSGEYPFAFFLAGATETDLSKMLDPNNESVAINKLYEGYTEWVTSNGAKSASWYKAE